MAFRAGCGAIGERRWEKLSVDRRLDCHSLLARSAPSTGNPCVRINAVRGRRHAVRIIPLQQYQTSSALELNIRLPTHLEKITHQVMLTFSLGIVNQQQPTAAHGILRRIKATDKRIAAALGTINQSQIVLAVGYWGIDGVSGIVAINGN